jgi:glycosyltransferase involved in cell wall biosynthesis
LETIKVAMIVRSTLYTVQGGDTIQALQTARSLRAQGIKVDIKLTNEEIDYSHYQLLHFFNITRPADILYHIRKTTLPFVVSTILINYSEYDKYHRKGFSGMLFRYLPSDSIEYLKAISRWILGRDKMMSLSYAWKGQKKSIHEIIKKAGLLLPNSRSEYIRLQEIYGCNANHIVVPNAVDCNLFKFNKDAKKDPKLVICIARVEGIKNQLNLIRALNDTSYHLLIIGAPAPNQPGYYQMCRNIASRNVEFIEHIPQQELVAYYQKAKVHVLPSWFETTGLSSLEAAAMGCNIVITDKGDTKEYFGNHAVYCSPASPESIYAAIEKASALPSDEILRSKIGYLYTWHLAGQHTAEGYKKIINN